jgi:hypothetical protein
MGTKLTELAPDQEIWRAVVSVVMNILVTQNAGSVFDSSRIC